MTHSFPWTRLKLKDRERLCLYAEELLQWSKTYNLIGSLTREELFDRHFTDGVVLLDHLLGTGKLADMGAGNGLPGIVVALLAESIDDIVLIESRKKRVRFLNHVVAVLGLTQVRVYHGEVQAAGALWGEVFDTVISRGFGDLVHGAKEAWPLLRAGGQYLTFKGYNYQNEFEYFHSQKICGGYEMPTVVYEQSGSGNRIVRMIKKS
ncbi:MAG: 16S rRNA (guanine(527)-N(7))-methyltransferase RsmG [Magnetococcales bacterium]|nr:16S rRNA (guanine(527)-N(7))-methyltransferase RsmG [Magnetococcales bacterium]